MTVPNYDDLMHDGSPRFAQNWDAVLNRTQGYMINGTADFTLNSITANTYNNLPTTNITGLIAGENITAGNVVRLKTADGKVWKADSGSADGILNILGIAKYTVLTGAAVNVITDIYTTTGLTTASIYYVSTAGAISTSPGTYIHTIGIALSVTQLQIKLLIPSSLAGTIITPAQTNITSLGTLPSLTATNINTNLITPTSDKLNIGYSTWLYKKVDSLAASGSTYWDVDLGDTNDISFHILMTCTGKHSGASTPNIRNESWAALMNNTTLYKYYNWNYGQGTTHTNIVPDIVAEGVVNRRLRITLNNTHGSYTLTNFAATFHFIGVKNPAWV